MPIYPHFTGNYGGDCLRNSFPTMTSSIPTANQALKGPFAMGKVSSMKQPQKPQPLKMKVISCPEVDQEEEHAILRLYKELVPGDLDRPINIGLIKNKGFPAFERTIGVDRFERLKAYFGIGCPQNKKVMSETKKKELIGALRTIENAQFYILGYTELLQKIALKLAEAPDEMEYLDRAKFVRMYVTLFCCYGFFPQDLENGVLNVSKAVQNNEKLFTPEELFEEYELKIKKYQDQDILCRQAAYELALLEDSVFEQALQFAELKVSDDGKYFVSVNKTVPNQTFYSVRALKNRVNAENGGYSVETFSLKSRIENLFVDTLYSVYKLLNNIPLKYFGTEERMVQLIENNRFKSKSHTFYKLGPEIAIGGPLEVLRFVNLFDFVVENGYSLKKEDGTVVHLARFGAAIKFAHAQEWITWRNSAKLDIRVAEAIMKHEELFAEQPGALLQYHAEEIDAETLMSRLKIDSDFEKEVRGIKKELGLISTEDTVVNFALANKYADSADNVSMELVKNVILPKNEEAFQDYESGKIDVTILKKRIGFEEEFAKMYFCFSKIDVAAIEKKLLDGKKGRSDLKDSKLLIALYRYIIKNQKPCGPKGRVPKNNKLLKVENLPTF